jgi:hypothetical protein
VQHDLWQTVSGYCDIIGNPCNYGLFMAFVVPAKNTLQARCGAVGNAHTATVTANRMVRGMITESKIKAALRRDAAGEKPRLELRDSGPRGAGRLVLIVRVTGDRGRDGRVL